MFEYCIALETVVLPETLEAIGYYAFLSCESLKEIHLPENLKELGAGAFGGCTELSQVNLPRGMTEIPWSLFADCKALENIEIPQGVTYIDSSAFWGCEGLTEIVLPPSLESIGEDAFAYCTGIEEIIIPNGVEYIGYGAFTGCSKLRTFKIDPSQPYFSCDEKGVLFNKDKTTLLSVPGAYEGAYTVPEGVTHVGKSAFAYCAGLTKAELPNSVQTLDESAFEGCTGLKEVTLSNSMTEITYSVFADCASLQEIKIPANIQDIEYSAFYGCTSLEAFHVDENNSCFNSDALGVLLSEDGTELLRYPIGRKGAYTVPAGIRTIGDDAFSGCTGLTEIILPQSIRFLGWAPFSDCTGLKKITIPGSITELNYADFYGCTALKEIYFLGDAPEMDEGELPDGVTLYYIEGAAGWTSPTWKGYPTKTFTYQTFKDVPASQYYYTPVLWAVEYGITNGTGKDLFSPDQDCTRGQIVTFLWRAAGSPEPASKDNPFTDVSAKDYYYKAVLWAVEQGITNGTSAEKFSPNRTCTRAQAVTFLWRANGEYICQDLGTPFTDVEREDYFYDAVLWAIENEITKGTGEAAFSPDRTCTRGQIVTFLYRADH